MWCSLIQKNAYLRHHEKLRQNGDSLKIDGEGPEDFHKRKLVIEQQSQSGDRDQKKFNPEGVVIAVVSSPEFHVHEIQRSIGCAQEDNLNRDSKINLPRLWFKCLPS